MTGNQGGAPTPAGTVDLGIPSIGPAQEIGRGAAGVVYRAEQPAFGRTVAVKLLPFAALDEAARARFERECRAMGTMSGHPGIVTVYEAGFTPTGQPFILMELMDGGSLEQQLAMRGAFRWEEVIEIGTRLAGALEVAHRKGILHRDIKPDNVLISTYGDAKLADFSIARLAGATKTATGLVAATPAHAPPEVLRGEEPSVRGDVYSLASTLYALLAGQPAFLRPEETTIFPLLRRVEEAPVPDLRPRGIPDPVCRVLERAMAKNPLDRPASANEFGAELLAARDQARAWEAAGYRPVPVTMAAVPAPPASPAMASPPPLAPLQAPPGAPPGMASPVPGAAWPAPPGPPRRGGLSRLALAAIIAAVALVAGGTILAVALTRGGSPSGSSTVAGTDTGAPSDSSSASSSESSSSESSGLDSRLLSAGDLGSDWSDSSLVTAFKEITPCNQQIPLGAKTDEADTAFMSSSGQLVTLSVATFRPGQAAAYMDAVRAAAGSCKSYDQTSSAGSVPVTIALRDAPVLGDQTVRAELKASGTAVGDVGEEVVLLRKADVVAVVVLFSPGNPDPTLADQIAHKQRDKI